ncbi:tagatose-bisphosphate aldolase [Enterococcus hirae]|uniref:tagatose-bisphosphate aldolase n=1 Tax=Enterococcus hirae TaxID=1354 RepID=UPI0027C85929|nr:tagatose-bisphosphate aldolase [Enterococcus hirae]MDQ2182747.1 tagatose-bisphosphate aldolase [Enterococcus hirae]
MKKIRQGKRNHLKNIVDENGRIGALAIDQRGALKKLIGQYRETNDRDIVGFKEIVSKELTPYASAILLDPEYGLPAAKDRAHNTGLLLAYEKTGYDSSLPGRLPDSLNTWSVKRLKEVGADACKFLLYYDVDENEEINEQKKAYIERIGSECLAEELPFFLEIISYDAIHSDTTTKEYAKIKPRKVIEAMQEFSKERYHVDVLKVEVPVNMNFVEGFGKEAVYSREEAKTFFLAQSAATERPFIFLSAGVSTELFQQTLRFAHEAGSDFNGVLCGRATWAEGVSPFVKEGNEAAVDWFQTIGKEKLHSLNNVLEQTASSIFNKIQ